MATLNYKCPNCAAPLKFNPEKQNFSCEYCFSEFDVKTIQDMYEQKEEQQDKSTKAEEKARQAQKSNTADEEEAFIYTCPSCGAEVVTTASTAATTCYYCQNPVVMSGRLSGDLKPDRVVPFALSKENAIEKFMKFCGKKKFLPKGFASKRQFEKFNGVYFPYWYVDEQKQAHLNAIGKKIRTWTSGNKEYTETRTYNVVRGGDVIIKNVFERALKGEDRVMMQSVHPFDLSQAKDFEMSYLSGFQAEKRDLERADLEAEVEQRLNAYTEELLSKSGNEHYDRMQTKSFSQMTELSSWNYTLLPVWVTTYKHGDKIYPYAINGQTGKIFGKLPVSGGKLAILFGAVTVGVFLLGLLGGMLLS